MTNFAKLICFAYKSCFAEQKIEYMNRSIYIRFLSTIFLFLSSILTYGQSHYVYEGFVCDSITKEPIPFVAIYVDGTTDGVLADDKGAFKVTTTKRPVTLRLSSMGYQKKVQSIPYAGKNIVLKMVPVGVELNEVVVKPKKEKYSKKNNPAVQFVEKIMARQELTNPRRNKYYNYDKYERITLALNNFTDESQSSAMFKKFPFLIDYVDTSEISGKPILNISEKEKYSEVHYRKDPKSQKEYVLGIRRVGLDDITDQESMQTFLEDIFREIDLYENDINILQNRFVSPLSRIATDFYKFYLTDTVDVSGENCVELSFAPHNAQMFGFTGRIYVPLGDSTMFIKKVKMNVSPEINLNFIDKFYLNQEFERAPDGSRLKIKDDMTLEISVLPGAQGLYARKNTTYKNHNYIEPSNFAYFDDPRKEIVSENAYIQDEIFWRENRLQPIAQSERGVESLITKLRSVPLYYWTEKVVKILVSGYISTGTNSKWDFGPMNTTISGNKMEGIRLRVGGITTANLSKRLFARTYVAYGTKDKKLKYSGELEYSFIDKKYHSREFPIQSIKLSHLYDVDKLGQQYLFTNMDNIFLSLKRKEDTQMTYHRVSKAEYTLELYNNFSVIAGLKHERQEATKYIPFIDGYGNVYSHYNQASFNVQLRYAPGEKFYQSKTHRYPINLDAPVFVLSHTFGPKNVFGNKFMLNKTEFSVQKRFWFSTFGYTDIIVKAGHVWDKTYFPNLLIPNANLSYTIQPESYALMNAMEFINDSYVSWDFTYWANGAILNYIPLVKKLKLREAFSFRGLWGTLSDKNNPQLNNDLLRFPVLARTREMGKTPYMELGVGIDNLFKILRVDYVWRLTYRDTPDCDKSGIRIALHFTF